MDGMNSLFRLMNKNYFFIFGCCPKNLAIAQTTALPDSGCSPLACTPMTDCLLWMIDWIAMWHLLVHWNY